MTNSPMIFFDLDGTLLDHETAQRATAATFQKRHADVFSEPTPVFLERWRAIGEKHMDRFFKGLTTEQGQRRARMRELFSRPDMPDGEADELYEACLEEYRVNWRVFPDVMNCLEHIQHPLGIITNGGSGQQRAKLAEVGIERFFSVIVISGEVGVAKPDPDIFARATREARLAPEDCVYIGDRLETDARAASRAGFRGIWLDRKGAAKDNIDVPVLHDLTDLKGFLDS